MKVHGSTLQACVLLSIAVVAQSVMNDGPRPERLPANARKDGWRLQRSGAPGAPLRHGPGGGPGPGPGPQLKRVYHVPQMKYGPPGHNPLRRQHPQQKIRYGPPGPPSGVRGPPPPGWKSKRVNPPGNYGPPPRKVRNPKPHKFQKPYSKLSSKPSSPKMDSFGNGVSSSFNQQVQTDSYGAPKTVYKVHKVPQTTYGIPHPTQGSPEPPKTADDSSSASVSGGSGPLATSFVHVFQGGDGGEQELETKTTYSFGGHSPSSYPEKHKGKVYDDLSNHSPVYSHNSSEPRPKKVGFQPPKQTYGFQPYDDKDHFSLTPSHSFFSVTSQQPVSSSGHDSLSHNYYDQNS